ncbi:GNAT family N-acetyltransferase [Alteromonas sp. 345S023]|uniref:GNAT family N-acetyltransferase n=1 Tax=Alteromonas profundi TaxID=2696062 RepID=A0A7X5LKA8_9ALTE|nr:GNAT family N-acetyltransferase [Alteromonas profundi]NDV90952.1 GNAT family N-acetyltransferase [Alteromonas profundi]
MLVRNSARLSFHYVTEADKEFLWELDQDEEVMRYINGGKLSSKEDIDNIFIPRVLAYSNPALGWGLWRVETLDSKESIGWILVRPFGFFTATPEIDNVELSWRFKRAYWGMGYATEAAKAIKDALYLNGIDQFSAIANPDNAASINIMKKLGMRFSHELEYKDSVYHETVVVYAT